MGEAPFFGRGFLSSTGQSFQEESCLPSVLQAQKLFCEKAGEGQGQGGAVAPLQGICLTPLSGGEVYKTWHVMELQGVL